GRRVGQTGRIGALSAPFDSSLTSFRHGAEKVSKSNIEPCEAPEWNACTAGRDFSHAHGLQRGYA
ncbi:MAG: hypothetical protein VX350_00020, partial [Pseudomonadota bacterium]|nr:hypothetical protein [Pseudomonadota bacterium]